MHLVPTFSTNCRGNTCYIHATQFLCWLKVQTFVSWFSDPLLAHLQLWFKTKVERWFSFILLATIFHRRLSWKHGSLRFFEERETDQRFFFLQSICSVNNRHLQTTNGSTLTLYLSFKGQRKCAARLSPFRGTTAMPCRNSCPWLPNPCPGDINVRMREVLARPWV